MQATNQFFDTNWLLYGKIYANNYLNHYDTYPLLTEHLRRRGSGRFLELGCGDAYWTLQLLEAAPPASYTGLDLSPVALEQARARLKGLTCPVELVQGDILATLPSQATYDTALASLSLHHLSQADKQSVFDRVCRLLSPRGCFYLVDIVRRADESRLEYLARRVEHIQAHWQALTAEELDYVVSHWYDSDFPETIPELEGMARKAGFQTTHTAYVDPTEAHGMLILAR